MNPAVYNISLLVGIGMVGVGVGGFDWRLGLIAVGALVLALTLRGAQLTRAR